MKRLGFCFAVFVFLCVLPLGNAFAQDVVSVQLDGEPLSFDVPPQIIHDRVMLPVRAV
ncbi:MAG TPA: copper amine oxidase, partial [Candidatus Aphodoplasma excrementigallinarum]|nr:copper amine oxidase [Candidatus Aphodoplasma excrementigallinarum]